MHRIDLLTAALQIERKSALYHSTYRGILSDVINMEEFEHVMAVYLLEEGLVLMEMQVERWMFQV